MASHTHRSILTRSFENTLRIVQIWRLQFVGLRSMARERTIAKTFSVIRQSGSSAATL
jgi:hypothetical protein